MRAIETTEPCPECGAEMPADSRFVTWCSACDWNVDPALPQETPDRLGRVRRALAHRHGEYLLADARDGESLRVRRDVSSLLAFVIALVVHGVTVAVTFLGVWLLVRAWASPGMVFGVVVLVIAWFLRPRLPRAPEEGPVLRRDDAPELHALVDEVAQVVGTRGVDLIKIDAEVNASVVAYGLRGRRLLSLGLPLWETLTPQQRVALLGHELAHFSNGDTRYGLVVGTAYRSLTIWCYYLAPVSQASNVEAVVNLLYIVPRLLVRGMLALLNQLTLRATRRAEYAADRGAARAASTEAAVGLMDRLLVADSIVVALRREINVAARNGPRSARNGPRSAAVIEAGPDGLWERLGRHMAAIPEHEHERRRRLSALRGHSVDETHPPTHLRRACLLVGPPAPAAVVADSGRERRIATELADARGKVAARIIRDGVAH
ncbi:M48 family metalloprotease [Streptomyces sp. NPDC086787]|uniref:M48 family metalloprotease n=1 Tax=Streptomyces sp. NPDC086787 TaxID=3365759 RepID=UPI003807FF01